MPLDEYRRKRDFSSTPEPAGDATARPGGTVGSAFVVHKHAARRLHFDLRLEVAGALASWAVPKGPSLDPADKRLAVHVEDHPLEYGTFEGVIPAGEYGGGTVMIWDRGTFLPVGDPTAGIAKGHLKFVLEGFKLRGAWALVRMKPRPDERQESWLLIKERDGAVRVHGDYDVVSAEPDSAASGRTMEQIAATGVEYESRGTATDADVAPVTTSAATVTRRAPAPDAEAPGVAPFPALVPFQLATPAETAPEGSEWIHEVKFDGYRVHAALEHGRATIRTRRDEDWTARFPLIAAAVEALPVSSTLLDGEVVVLDADGRSDFGRLQDALAEGRALDIRLAAFDLLYLDGFDLRAETLLRRKDLLASLMASGDPSGPLSVVEHYTGGGPEFHAASCRLLLEGSVSKRGDRPWVPGRTRDWLKVKCVASQEFVVGGWTDPAGSRAGFGALLLGVHDAGGALRYAGRVGSGFAERTLVKTADRLRELASGSSPFTDAPASAHVHWVRPEMVVEVAFREWTRGGVVRQPVFTGIRDDRDPAGVVRESPDAEVDEPGVPSSSPGRSGRRIDRAIQVAGITITNPGRRLEPAGITKAELAGYYESVSDWMLPHVVGRPLTIVRCPRGVPAETGCFYQKHPETRGWPDVFEQVTIEDRDGPAVYFSIVDERGLLALAQMGTLEIHAWNSLVEDPEHPDRIVFDLDPGPGVVFPEVAAAARTVRDALEALGLGAFVKTTGGRGLHVVTPIVPGRGYDEVRALAHGVVDFLATRRPEVFTASMAKGDRPGRVFVDYLRNAHGATAVSAYSTRARPGASISVPVAWDRLSGLDPAAYDIHTVPRRLAALRDDPWRGYDDARRALGPEVFAALGVGESL